MKKVAIDVREALIPEPAGKGFLLRFLLEALLKEKLPFKLILLGREDQKAPPHWPLKKLKAAFWHLSVIRYLASYKIDLFVSPLSAIVPALIDRPRTIFLVMDLSAWRYPEEHQLKTVLLERLFVPLAVKKAFRLMAISSFTKKELTRLLAVPAGKVEVMPLAPTLQEGKAWKPSFPKYLLYLGTLEPRKNIERLLKAYQLASQKQKLPPLLLAGKWGWKTRPIQAQIKKTPSVYYLGYLPDEKKKALLKGASGFLYPSLYEGFGLPPLEALSLGVPTLVSRAAALPEVGGRAVLLVNPRSVQSIAGGIIQLLNPKIAARLRRASKDQAKKFSWQKTARILLKTINASLKED